MNWALRAGKGESGEAVIPHQTHFDFNSTMTQQPMSCAPSAPLPSARRTGGGDGGVGGGGAVSVAVWRGSFPSPLFALRRSRRQLRSDGGGGAAEASAAAAAAAASVVAAVEGSGGAAPLPLRRWHCRCQLWRLRWRRWRGVVSPTPPPSLGGGGVAVRSLPHHHPLPLLMRLRQRQKRFLHQIYQTSRGNLFYFQ